MLLQINIQNFILIERAIIDFGPGLNVVSGETGAGKSIFLAALNATLGEKIGPEAILPGKETLKVISVFDIATDNTVKTMLDEMSIDYEDERLSLRREVSVGGKSKCFINGILVKNNQLKSLVAHLIDIHGQHQNQHLFQVRHHQKLLDGYLGLDPLLKQYRDAYQALLAAKRQFQSLCEDEEAISKQKEYLKFTVAELDNALIPEDTFEQLKEKLKKMESFEQRLQFISEAESVLADETLSSLQKIQEALTELSRLDSSAEAFVKQIVEILSLVESLKVDLSNLQPTEQSGSNLDAINEKLANVERLRKKYGKPIPMLFEQLQEAKDKLSRLENVVLSKEDVIKKIADLESLAMDLATRLHIERKKGATQLAEKIQAEIDFLGMEDSAIDVSLKVIESERGVRVEKKKALLNEQGLDEIEFLYAPTQKAGFKKLREIVSGGEVSRLMLAFKIILFQNLPLHTMVFDEIDTGIGGNTAVHVGKKIKELSASRQLIVITHLPQIAKFSSTHFSVRKLKENGEILTQVRTLSESEKTVEIARMLGGEGPREEQLAYAKNYLHSN